VKHLDVNGDVWCDAINYADETDDPRDATCTACLKIAAAYGAAAAMRYAAVEAGATQDPELVRERDEAIRRVDAVNNALERQGAFFCNDCMKLCRVSDRALNAGGVSWCRHCAPMRVS
jgi:hypothetical protein